MKNIYESECTFPVVGDTKLLQLKSLLDFAGALGYDGVYDLKGNLQYFKCEKNRRVGRERIAVNTMISMHNRLPGQALRQLQDGAKVNFHELVSTNKGEDLLLALFAGYARTIRKIKMVRPSKGGMIVQSHKVSFLTRRDRSQYESWIQQPK